MKNIARISRDYHSQLSDDMWNEDLKRIYTMFRCFY